MRLRNLLLLLTLAPAIVAAQATIKLDFGSDGDREVWVGDQWILPASTLKVKAKNLEIPRQGGDSDRLFIWDRKSGNLASKPVTQLKGSWKVSPEDYTHIAVVTVRIEHDGKAAPVDSIRLKDENEKRGELTQPGTDGEAKFFGIQPGKVVATAIVESKDADSENPEQSFVVNLKRDSAEPVLSISLRDAPAGATPPRPESKAEEKPSSPPEKGGSASLIGSIIIYLIALAAAAAAIYFGLKYLKGHQGKVQEHLEQIGVQVPSPADPTPADPAPLPIAPAPPQKIILTDAGPGAFPTPPPHSQAVDSPSLIMENGDVFPIPDGETSVGRDASSGLALVTETTVSRRHATLVNTDAGILIRDEGSSNGTYVNGTRIDAETPLKAGDQIQFGQARFRFEA